MNVFGCIQCVVMGVVLLEVSGVQAPTFYIFMVKVMANVHFVDNEIFLFYFILFCCLQYVCPLCC